jgi:hypothetical protein
MAISDNRARLETGRPDLYCQGPAVSLTTNRGILFPNQPDISYQQSVNYNTYDLVHTNYSYHSYRNTPSAQIQVTAQFAQTTREELAYVLGVIHFLRSVTKMYYGTKDIKTNPTPLVGETLPGAGTPPPVLRFSAFGSQQFNRIPVVVGNFATTYDSSVDLVEINGQSVPVVQTISIDLMQQQNPDRQKRVFSKHGFLNGSLYGEGFI